VLPSARTGLTTPDVFYFGHLQGDAGNTTVGARSATVDARDEAVLRRKVSKSPVNGGNPWDFDHNGVVSVADLILSRRAWGTSLPMFTAPAAPAAAFSQRAIGDVAPRMAPTRRGSLDSITTGLLA
jgi:hypothetical protein